MTTIEVYPSSLPGEPIERHQVRTGGTLHDWMTEHCPGYVLGETQPVSASVGGQVVPPLEWDRLQLCGQVIELRPNARGIEWIIAGVAMLIGVAVAMLMKPAIPSASNSVQGAELMAASLQANTPKLNQIIPEVAGRYRLYPDYLCQPRRYFVDQRVQAIDVMLSIGCGEFAIDPGEIMIGETKLADLEGAASYTIFPPGANVSGHQAHRNWYNAPEVGPATGSSGLRMTSGVPGTAKATATSYVVNGSSITVPLIAGRVPQDWETGNIISVVARVRTIEIRDGAYLSSYDIVQGKFGDLGLTVGRSIRIIGIGKDDVEYRVASLTAVGGALYDMTLDYLGSVFDSNTGNWSDEWVRASALPVGTHTVDLYPVTYLTQSGVTIFGQLAAAQVEVPPRYRLVSEIFDTSTGSPILVGWQLKRVKDDGTDDAAWSGFESNMQTANVTMTKDQSQLVGGWLGPFRATPADEYTSLIELEVFAPQGLASLTDSGDINPRTRYFDVSWRAEGGGWTKTTYVVSGASRDQLGWRFEIPLPAPCKHVDVRVRRVSSEDTSVKSLDRLEWYTLRTLLAAPTSYAGITTMALTLHGSDVIAARTENQINVVATRKLGGVATRSIALWVQYVCESIGYGSGDLSVGELAALGSVWDARGDTFDHAIVEQTTVREALNDALRAGFAELTIDAGQIRPVRDQPRSVFEHMYTPQNMRDALQRQVTAYNPDDYDGVDVEFVNGTTWKTETVECRLPGDLGTRVEKLKLDGVLDRTRAWRIGMRRRRTHAYRRKSYTFRTEWDAMNSRYLSYCALADDVPGYGQSALLLSHAQSADGVLLQSSEPLRWEEGAAHVVALRRPDGTLFGPHAAQRVADDLARIATPLDFTPIADGDAQETTHLLHGTVERWSYPALITSITPSGEDVEITGVNYDPRIYADDDNAPPT